MSIFTCCLICVLKFVCWVWQLLTSLWHIMGGKLVIPAAELQDGWFVCLSVLPVLTSGCCQLQILF